MNSNYLKYAFGEIALVVIGILIALSINNWNENRKETIGERLILEKLKAENLYNLNILYQDTTFTKGIANRNTNLYVYLRNPKLPKSDSVIANSINGILSISLLNFSKEYLERYINSSKMTNDELVTEFIELKEILNGIELSSKLAYEYKVEKLINILEQSLDFSTGEITDISKLADPIFINRLVISDAIETSKIRNFQTCIDKAKRIDSLISVKLNN